MSEEDINKAVNEAAEFEAADKKRKEGIEAKNDADTIIFQTQKALDEAGDKLDPADKTEIENDISALKGLVEGLGDSEPSEAQINDIKAAKDKLMVSSQKVFEKLYAQTGDAGAAGGAAGGPGPDMGGNPNAGATGGSADGSGDGSSPYGDDVVDGDYKEV